jgi:hypothetical protein
MAAIPRAGDQTGGTRHRGKVGVQTWDSYRRDLGVVRNKPTWKLRPKSAAGERLMALDPMTIQA